MNLNSLHDNELEKVALGCCMNAGEVLPDITENLFFTKQHQDIFKAIKAGYVFPDAKTKTEFGIDDQYFLSLLESTFSSNINPKSLSTLIELSARRTRIDVLRAELGDLHNLTTDARSLNLDLLDGSEILTREELTNQVADGWAKSTRVSTGFYSLDVAAGGFGVSDVWILAGRSGTGKTSLGMQVLDNICKAEGCAGIFFSIEMAKNQLFTRLAMSHYYAEIDNNWVTGNYKEAREIANDWLDQNKSRELIDFLYPKRYSICWKGGITVSEMASYIRRERKSGKDVKYILVDYVQLLRSPGAQDRRNEMAQVARDLKAMSKKEMVGIIGLCQLSRAGEDGTVPPRLHHLKEAGDWEEIADVVTGNWKGYDESHTRVSPLKNRNAGIGNPFVLGTDGVYFRTPHQSEDLEWEIR